jgi:hypothetical protein
MRRLSAVRYVTPLREGGSLPAIVEVEVEVEAEADADAGPEASAPEIEGEGALLVVKFRGAGQGGRALAAELIAGELARAAGLPVPELALVELAPGFGRSEPDPEIRDLLLASAGVNLGMGYLPGAVAFDLAARPQVEGGLASAVVVFDAFVTNVDRTPRNPNLLWWRGALWLIDHGAALYWHHGWEDAGAAATRASAARPFPHIADHALLSFADELPAAGQALAGRLDDQTLARIVALVPDDWIEGATGLRQAYVEWLRARRDAVAALIEEAMRARAQRV